MIAKMLTANKHKLCNTIPFTYNTAFILLLRLTITIEFKIIIAKIEVRSVQLKIEGE
jgi:hypothetical protein